MVLKSQTAVSVSERTDMSTVKRITMHMVCVRRRGLLKPSMMGTESMGREEQGIDSKLEVSKVSGRKSRQLAAS